MSNQELLIRQMRRQELDVLVEWADKEGWNPGLSDADIFWATDPTGFVAAELNGQMIGGGSIVSYDGIYGFMGFFIVHPDHRGQGLGDQLWHARRDRLINRLHQPAVIGMDGVFDMQAYYAKGGFSLSARDLRFEGVGMSCSPAENIVELCDVEFADIVAYDRIHFPAPRPAFLRLWLDQQGAHAFGYISGGKLAGIGVIRPCRSGYKIGPLFADSPAIAHALYRALSNRAPGQPVFLDVPENNSAAIAMAKQFNMKEVFGCAKMYYGPAPDLPVHQIFGVTTFELG